MAYEYHTEELKLYYTAQADRINELAKEGWELITVSFNIGYFKRGTVDMLHYVPTIRGKDETIIDGKTNKILHNPAVSKVNTQSKKDKK